MGCVPEKPNKSSRSGPYINRYNGHEKNQSRGVAATY